VFQDLSYSVGCDDFALRYSLRTGFIDEVSCLPGTSLRRVSFCQNHRIFASIHRLNTHSSFRILPIPSSSTLFRRDELVNRCLYPWTTHCSLNRPLRLVPSLENDCNFHTGSLAVIAISRPWVSSYFQAVNRVSRKKVVEIAPGTVPSRLCR
jgi:hypothetical protein